MDVIAFLSVSMLEWFALVLLTFVMYRLDIRHYIGQLAFTAFLLSLCSYMLIRVLDMPVFATLAQPVFVFLFFWLMFKMPVLFAGLIAVNGYLTYCLVASLLDYVVGTFSMPFPLAAPGTYAVRTAAALVGLLLAGLAAKFRLGFSFIPRGFEASRLSGMNARLLPLTIAGYLSLCGYSFLNEGTGYAPVALAAVITAFFLAQYRAVKKEREEAFWRKSKKANADA